MMAQWDKPKGMRRVLAPMVAPHLQRVAAMLAGLSPFALFATVAEASGSAQPLSDVGSAVVRPPGLRISMPCLGVLCERVC